MFSERDLEDTGEKKKSFRRCFTFGSDCVRNKRQQRSIYYCKDYRSSTVSTSIGISLSFRYKHYSVLSAIVRNVVLFPGCGKELLFWVVPETRFHSYLSPRCYAATWTSVLPYQRNPSFDLTFPNKGKQRSLKHGRDALLELNPVLFQTCTRTCFPGQCLLPSRFVFSVPVWFCDCGWKEVF